MGRVLLTRSKPVAPTASGAGLLRAARQMQAIAADVLAELSDEASSGRRSPCPLAVNADSLATWFVEALADAGPGLTFDIRRADQTRTAELLRDGTVMAAVTASAQPVSGCTVHRSGRMRYCPRASAAFVARWFADGVTARPWRPSPGRPLRPRGSRSRTSISPAPLPPAARPTALLCPGLGRVRPRRPARPGLGHGPRPAGEAAAGDAPLVEFDPRAAIDVPLHWQQWRRSSPALERVSAPVRAHAAAVHCGSSPVTTRGSPPPRR